MHGDHQRGLHTCRQPLFATPLQVQALSSVHAIPPALSEALAAHGWIQIVEAVDRVLVNVALARRDDRAIVPRYQQREVGGRRQACGTTGFANDSTCWETSIFTISRLTSDVRVLFIDDVLKKPSCAKDGSA